MRNKDIRSTIIAICFAHLLLSVFMALACGTSHPLSFLYVEGNPLKYIICSCLMAIPLYMIIGFFFIVGKMYLDNMRKTLLLCSFVFFLILLSLFFLCYLLRLSGLLKGSWVYYVILNYPTGVIMNNISLLKDGLNYWFILTTIPGPLGFYTGAIIRYIYEQSKISNKG